MRDQVLAILGRHLPHGHKLQPSGGNNVLTKCPFHGGGQERKPSFSIELEKGLYHCFTCHRKGDITGLLRELGTPSLTIERETASLKPYLKANREKWVFQQKHAFVQQDPFRADFVLPETILGVYEFCPARLLEDGFSEEVLRKLEIGYDRNQGRIMYPLRDMYGNLAGFSGGAGESGMWPKYKVYQGRRQDERGRYQQSDFGSWFDEMFPGYRCENHDFLWNFHRVREEARRSPLYIVEGFKAAMWLIQNGYPNTVALMGSYISPRQQQMLQAIGASVILFLDNDAAGQKATINVGDLLWWPLYGRVQVVHYPEEDEDTQPDDYEPDAVHTLIRNAVDFRQHLRSLRS